MFEIEKLFDLDYLVKWIIKNSYKYVALEFPEYLVKFSVSVTKYLKNKLSSDFNFYTIVLNCCCVDYVSPRHYEDKINCIIRFGNCCLAILPKQIKQKPVLFLIENLFLENNKKEFLNKFFTDNFSKETLFLIENNYLIPTLKLVNDLNKKINFAKLPKLSNTWEFSENSLNFVINPESNYNFNNFIIDEDLSFFKKLIYIGDRIPTSFKIMSQLEILFLNMSVLNVEKISSNRELMRRSALIEKIRKMTRFGIIFVHSYPDVDLYTKEIKKLALKNKKIINFISIVQTTDECKLGNFPELECLVLVNNCYCSKLLDSLNLHIPIVNLKEFQISCNLKINYGQVNWNENIENESNHSDEEINEKCYKLILDDSNKALRQNYLDEDKWFGLKVNAGETEISELKQGLKGIPTKFECKNKEV